MKRRFFLFAAPAIVAAPSLMKISALAMPAGQIISGHVEHSILYGQCLYSRYFGYETLSLSPGDVFTISALDWSKAAQGVALDPQNHLTS